jgi:23S rRNA (uracil1939-C5)-methyltransferase
MPRPLRIQATVESLAPGGAGVAHADIDGERRALFISNGAPGDVILAEVDPSQRPARGRIVELYAPGPNRVTPACPWSTRCGGCDWMHLSVDAQMQAHIAHVQAALPPAWRGVHVVANPAPDALEYRGRARLHVRSRRGRAVVGMHGPRTHLPVDVDTCVVLEPALERARRLLSTLFDGSDGHGEVQIALGVARIPVLDLQWIGDLAATCFARIERSVAARDLAGARVTIDGASRPAVIGDPTPWIVGADGAPLRLAPGGFAQASERTSAMLARHVAALAHGHGVDRAVEFYAGAGNLSVLLGREVRDLVLVESSADACAAARINLESRGIDARVVHTEAASYALNAGTKLVVLDPPRTGAYELARRLAASRVRHVVYVSCDTQTLGRDLKILAGAYEPTSVATFEMFPQTSHVETVVGLARHAGHARDGASQ